MKVKLISIGNSKGIRIPQTVLKQCYAATAFDLRVENSCIILEPIQRKVRNGWKEAFQKMRENQDDVLIFSDKLQNNFDTTEWEW